VVRFFPQERRNGKVCDPKTVPEARNERSIKDVGSAEVAAKMIIASHRGSDTWNKLAFGAGQHSSLLRPESFPYEAKRGCS
jgi:hypothetical protein